MSLVTMGNSQSNEHDLYSVEPPSRREMSTAPQVELDPEAAKYGEYTCDRFLSEGSFGKVILATKDDQKYTLKIVPEKLRASCEHEIRVLQDLQDVTGVARYVEHFEDVGELIIVYEYCPGVDLLEYLRQYGTFSIVTSLNIFEQLCKATAVAHAKGIVHRDIKPQNIIINTGIATLIDWGFAFYPAETSERKSCGSPHFAAPELLDRTQTYDGPEIDVWSLGCVFHVILTGRAPFESDHIPELFNKIRRCEIDYSNYSLHPSILDIFKAVFVSATERATLAELLEMVTQARVHIQ